VEVQTSPNPVVSLLFTSTITHLISSELNRTVDGVLEFSPKSSDIYCIVSLTACIRVVTPTSVLVIALTLSFNHISPRLRLFNYRRRIRPTHDAGGLLMLVTMMKMETQRRRRVVAGHEALSD